MSDLLGLTGPQCRQGCSGVDYTGFAETLPSFTAHYLRRRTGRRPSLAADFMRSSRGV
jgi:hypothetical protein